MAYYKSRGLRGSLFEELINRTNAVYIDDELAVIQKLPTSITPVELDNDRKVITLAYFDSLSTVDYMGNIQGIPVCFDAKETSKMMLPISNIKAHQIEFMDKFQKQGGLSFLIVNFNIVERIFLLDFETLNQYYTSAVADNGRKSIPIEAFNEEYEIKRCGRYLVHYLEAVEKYLDCLTNRSVKRFET
jgi:recombination protein U